MEITEIRIKLMEGSEDRLRAFCSITIDQSFVVRDLKIIDGSHGPFVAMPSRKLTGHCNRCGSKNHLRAGFCNQCGAKLHNGGTTDSPQKLYADVAHPINSECREMIQNAVIEEFNAEIQRSSQPNYRSRYDDDFDAGDYDEADYVESNDAPTQPVSNESTTPASTAPTSTPSPPIKSSDRQPDFQESDAFAAGLFENEIRNNRRRDEEQVELDAPHFDTSSHDASKPGNPPEEDSVIVRSESGVSNAIPRPHFRDRPGSTTRHSISTSPSSQGGRGADRDDVNDDDNGLINPGFGAGILDD